MAQFQQKMDNSGFISVLMPNIHWNTNIIKKIEWIVKIYNIFSSKIIDELRFFLAKLHCLAVLLYFPVLYNGRTTF